MTNHDSGMSYVDRFADGLLWDRDGKPWRRRNGWLEPDAAADLLAAGSRWLVQWCGEGFTWYDQTSVTAKELQERMIDRGKARRLLSKRVTRTMIVAEHWCDDVDGDLVVFFESGPAPRTDSWFR